MFCSKCGTELPADAVFCRNCGIPLASKYKPNRKNHPKSPLVLVITIIAAVLLVVAVIYGMANKTELTNTQTTNANVFRFLCQKNNEQPYFCIPVYSDKVFTYNNGEIKAVYTSKRIIVSIFDADDKLILETKESETEGVFTSIDKKTGAEEDLLYFDKDQSAYILNVFQNKIYYNLVMQREYTQSIADYKTYTYNLDTGENQYLLDGGCYITKQGIYYAVKGKEFGELWYVKFADIESGKKEYISGAVHAGDTTRFLTPVFVDQGYTYYFWSANGWTESESMWFERAGKSFNTVAYGDNLNVNNGRMFFIQDGSLYNINPYALTQKTLMIQDVTPGKNEEIDYGYGIYDFALFLDPQDSTQILIATMGVLSNEIFIWDENGELITKYELKF